MLIKYNQVILTKTYMILETSVFTKISRDQARNINTSTVDSNHDVSMMYLTGISSNANRM